MTKKSLDHLRAQAEAFSRTIDDYEDRRVVAEKIDEVVRIENIESPESVPEVNDLVKRYQSQYLDFVKSPEGRAEVKQRLKYLEAYNEKFAEPVSALKAKISRAEDRKALPEYLGSGSNGDAYRVAVDGVAYAVKVHRHTSVLFFDELVQAEGIDNVVSLVAFSPEENVTVMPLIEGTEITKYPERILPQFQRDHVKALIETIIQLEQRGLAIDPKPSNFIYDPEVGFKVLDFQVRQSPLGNLADQLSWLQAPFSYYDWSYENALPEDERQAFTEKAKIAGLKNLTTLLEVLNDDYPELIREIEDNYQVIKADPWAGTSAYVDPEYEPKTEEAEVLIGRLQEFGFDFIIDDNPDGEPVGMPDEAIFEKSLTPEAQALLDHQWAIYQKAKKARPQNEIEKRLRQGEKELPVGTLVHGTPYNRETITSMAKHGVISGEIIGIPEAEVETHYCADFFRVPEDMTTAEYMKRWEWDDRYKKPSQIKRQPMEDRCLPVLGKNEKVRETQRRYDHLANRIGVIVSPNNPAVQKLLENDAYRTDNEAMSDIVNYLPAEDELARQRVSAVLVGMPASLITGFILTETLANDPEEIAFIKKRFSKAILFNVDGERIA